jgi:hypothetical protein
MSMIRLVFFELKMEYEATTESGDVRTPDVGIVTFFWKARTSAVSTDSPAPVTFPKNDRGI